jgi:hypothetical protein
VYVVPSATDVVVEVLYPPAPPPPYPPPPPPPAITNKSVTVNTRANVTVSDVVDVAVTEYMLNPDTDVDRLDVTPPENVAVTLSGTLMMTMPEPPAPPS